jgi:hypothetical protein
MSEFKLGDKVRVVSDHNGALGHVFGEIGTIVLDSYTKNHYGDRYDWIVDFPHLEQHDYFISQVHVYESEIEIVE